MITTAAWATPLRAAPVADQSIDFTYRGTITDDAVRLGDKCYVTLDFLTKVGWEPSISGLDCRIHDGGRTHTIPLYSISGHQLACLNEIATELGAKAYYGKESDVFYYKSLVTGVRLTPVGVQIETSQDAQPTVTQTENPPRMTIDLKGTEYDPMLEQTLPTGWKLAYTGVDTVRLSIDHPALAYVRAPKLATGRNFKLALPEQVISAAASSTGLVTDVGSHSGVTVFGGQPSENGALPFTGEDAAPGSPVQMSQAPARHQDSIPTPPVHHYTPSRGGDSAARSPFGPGPNEVIPPQTQNSNPNQIVVLGDTHVQSDTDDELTLQVMTGALQNGSVSARYINPTSLMVTFKGAVWGNTRDVTSNHLARGITRVTDGPNAALRIDTETALIFDLTNSYNSATIRLTRPKSGGLGHKLIVIDPGHGGSDHGGSYGTLFEKDITLRVGLAVSKALHKEGASVILTRDDDSYPSLTQRCDIANTSRADAFISIHVNDVSSSAPSASMTFYHGGNGAGMLLAECIQTEIARVTKPESWGYKDDYTRFRGSGMFVLHHTNAPGVLTEIGFINNANDRADMLSDDYADRVANAIVRGLQNFFGGRN